ncbi:MAG: phage integrase SAM-like domain-containing protein, partial [Bacteroides cellulosilyticus]
HVLLRLREDKGFNALQHLERTRSIDFIQFCKRMAGAATTDIKGKKNLQVYAVNALIAYIGNEHLDVTKLTATFLRGFTEYLSERRMERIKVISEAGGRITSNRAVSLYLGSIRHLFNEVEETI